MSTTPRYRAHLNTAEQLGWSLPPGAKVLDFGAGTDRTLRDFMAHGYDAYGCDFASRFSPSVQDLVNAGRLVPIEEYPYRLPFANDSFDLIVSNQVLEHVMDYEQTLAELARILRPAGVSINVFPARGALIEPHVSVPFATIFRPYWWLFLWATLGIRKSNQRSLSASSVARINREYLVSSTNYLTKRELQRTFQAHFAGVQFETQTYFFNYPRFRRLYNIMCWVPGAFRFIETFHTRVAVLSRPL